MKKGLMVLMGVWVLILSMPYFAQAQDKPGCKDHSLFPVRMPDYRIEDCKVEEFGAYDFFTAKGPKTRVEGKFTFITYAYTGQRNLEPSGLSVVRNYESAFQNVGGTILQSDPQRWVNGKIIKDNREVWFQAEKGNGKIWLRIVEKQAMAQHVVADVAALDKGIRDTGHVAVYEITFDTDSASIKPESAQAIEEITKLLKSDQTLKIVVVGHTDNVGAAEHNLKLSQERGQAVMQALIQKGIAADRLKSYGCGQYAPVASNDSDEGRAKNRRVELVKQ